jgi:hypothetical protein
MTSKWVATCIHPITIGSVRSEMTQSISWHSLLMHLNFVLCGFFFFCVFSNRFRLMGAHSMFFCVRLGVFGLCYKAPLSQTMMSVVNQRWYIYWQWFSVIIIIYFIGFFFWGKWECNFPNKYLYSKCVRLIWLICPAKKFRSRKIQNIRNRLNCPRFFFRWKCLLSAEHITDN